VATLKRGNLALLLAGFVLVLLAIWLLAAPKPDIPARAVPSASDRASATTPLPAERKPEATREETAPHPTTSNAPSAFPDALRYTGPVRDRTRADALREALTALYAGQLAAQAEQDAGAPGKTIPAPEGSGNQADKAPGRYIAQVMREQFIPLASGCYEQLLEARPTAAGDIELKFSIMGDSAVGGVVVDAELGSATTITDAPFATCIRESMFSLVFAPPPKGHPTLTVTQSLTLEP
jgi:hypothetical protein